MDSVIRFGTIRNSTALKPSLSGAFGVSSFGTIRNSTALKQTAYINLVLDGFGTIRNSTALKLIKKGDKIYRVLGPFETAQL